MTDKVEAFLIFCEDFRLDDGEKPMMIGVLSPVFETSPHPGVSDQVFLITFVNMPPKVSEVALKLRVQFEQPGAEPIPASFATVLKRPRDVVEGDPWAAFLPLPIPVDEWKDGTLITGALNANGVAAHAHLKCRIPQRAKAGRKARPKSSAKKKLSQRVTA